MLSKKARALLGDGWKLAHQDAMVNGFLWSVSGAGPIRQIGTIQVLFGAGPGFCQAADGGRSTRCVWSCARRLLLVTLWNSFISGAYCVYRQDAALTRQFLRNTACGVACLVLTACLAQTPGTVELSDGILGKEHSGKSTASVLVLSGLYGVYLSTAMGRRWMFGAQVAALAVALVVVTAMPFVAGDRMAFTEL